jgi:catechol 2,3-dioxygenase-like lactoylglutathione lyase family enzyme
MVCRFVAVSGMAGLQIYMIGLIVEDMGASLDFYRRLGLDVPSANDSTHVEIEMAGGMMLFLDSRPQRWDPGFEPSPLPEPGTYRSLLEFYLESETKVREKFGEMVDNGYRGTREPYLTPFDMCFAFIEDPDGNAILLSGNSNPAEPPG